MGGSGSSGPYYDVNPDQLKDRVKEARDEISKGFSPTLQEFLDEKLSKFNRRDVALIATRQMEVLKSISELLDSNWDLRMGGSVSKHTYVDGLSDIDNLLIMKDFTVERSPKEVLSALASKLVENNCADEVSVGQLAVTARS